MAWAAVLAAFLGAGAQAWSADQSAGAVGAGSKEAIKQAVADRNLALRIYEPSRALGYGAMSDLASLYGYALPGYTSYDQLINGAGGASGAGGYPGGTGVNGSSLYGGGLIKVNGRSARSSLAGITTGSNHSKKFGGYIDPATGNVVFTNAKGKKAAKKEARLEEYLKTGDRSGLKVGKHPKMSRFVKAIDNLYGSGWTYNPNAANGGAGGAGTTPDAGVTGQPSMSRFFTSPDYQWRLGQGTQAVERSAAASGGLFSGNTGAALTEFAQGAASQEYGNYFNRLMAMVNGTQANTSNAASTVTNAGSTIINANQDAAAGRASAYGQYGQALNDLLGNLYYAYRRNG